MVYVTVTVKWFPNLEINISIQLKHVDHPEVYKKNSATSYIQIFGMLAFLSGKSWVVEMDSWFDFKYWLFFKKMKSEKAIV